MADRNAKLFLFLILSSFITFESVFANKDRILLKDVDVLTLSSDRWTNARRSSPIKQLQCVGGSADCSKFTPKVVQCYNRGSDGYDVNWECKADLPSDISFGKLTVSCEGYDNPNDKYVLRGSCGLEYTLDSHKKHSSSSQYFTNNNDQQSSGILSFIVFIGIIGIIAVLYFVCISPNNNVNVDDNRSNYGPPPFDSQARPPPPGFIDPNYPSAPPSYEESQTRHRGNFFKSSTYTTPTGSRTQTSSNNDGPGFWSGAALGGLAGYFAGRGSGSTSSSTYSRPYTTNYYSSPTTTTTTSSRQSSSSSDTSMRTASGFATTSRR